MATATAPKPTRSKVAGVNVTNNADLAAKIARVEDLKQIEREGAAAARERKDLEAELQAALAAAGEEQFVKRGVVIARLSSQRHAHLYDYKTLQEAFPEAYQAVHSLKPYRFLTVL